MKKIRIDQKLILFWVHLALAKGDIVSQYNFVHLSADDLLRAERSRHGSELAQTIEEYISVGQILSVAVTCSLIFV